jgi:hypothetical protein
MLVTAFAGVGSGAMRITMSGHVVTKSGVAAPNCIVKLSKAAIADTTDATGFYVFQQNTNIVFDGAMGFPPLRSPRGISSFFAGNETRMGMPDGMRIYAIDGRNLKPGPAAMPANPPRGIYFCVGIAASEGDQGPPAGLAKSLAAVDTLKVVFRDTLLTTVEVPSYTDTLGVKLDGELPAKYPRMLVASYSNNAAYILDNNGNIERTFKVPGACQDAWMLPNGHVLLAGGDSVKEVYADGSIVWAYKSPCGGEIHNCQPLPGGLTLIGENCSGKLLHIDTHGTVVRSLQTTFTGTNHGRFRMVRKTVDSTYLIVALDDGSGYEIDTTGTKLRTISGARHSLIRLGSGNLMYGGYYNGPFAEINKSNQVVWQLTAADIPDIGFNYAAAMHILPNGNMVIAAYTSTCKLFEITRDKKIVWKLQNPAIGNPTHVYVLEDLRDPAKFEIER